MGLLSVDDELPSSKPADLILALGVGLRPDGSPGQPTTAVAERVVQLCRQGVASTVLLSGGYQQGNVTEAQAMESVLRVHGVTAQILLDQSPDHVQGTPRQPITAATLFREKLARWPARIVLVAHPVHLPRALWLFRKALPQIEFLAVNSQEIYDPCSSQRRLRGKLRFAVWNLMAWCHHWLFVRVESNSTP